MVCVAFYLTGALKISLEFIKINHNDSSSSLQFIIIVIEIGTKKCTENFLIQPFYQYQMIRLIIINWSRKF